MYVVQTSRDGQKKDTLGYCGCINFSFTSPAASSISATISTKYRSSYLQRRYVDILILSRQGFWTGACFPRKLNSDSNSLSSDTLFILMGNLEKMKTHEHCCKINK